MRPPGRRDRPRDGPEDHRAGTISWGYPPIIFHGFYAPEGTTDHHPLVDSEVETILRAAARLEGRGALYVAQATEIVGRP